MGISDWFYKMFHTKKRLEVERKDMLGELEKKAESTRMPSIPAMMEYMQKVQVLHQEGYDMSKYQETFEKYVRIVGNRTK